MLFRLLKNASRWVYRQIEKSGEAIVKAEERIHFGDDYEGNKK